MRVWTTGRRVACTPPASEPISDGTLTQDTHAQWLGWRAGEAAEDPVAALCPGPSNAHMHFYTACLPTWTERMCFAAASERVRAG